MIKSVLTSYTPILLIISNIYWLWGKTVYLYGYIIGYIISMFVNNILKELIKEPRPSEDKSLYYAKLSYSINLLRAQEYGMPSGHAQELFYSLIYLVLVMKSQYILVPELLIIIYCLYERLVQEYHTLKQLVVGSIVGIMMGYVVYKIVNAVIKI